MKNVFAVIIGTVCLVAITAHAAGNIEAGHAKAAVCMGCHGPNGKSPNPKWPNLAGQVPGYISKQLADFKSGVRANPIMAGQAAALNKQDMANLDAYFSSLTLAVAGTSKEKAAKHGERIYRGGNYKTGVSACMSCHGPTGHGIPPRFPRISGQNSGYVQDQLLAFKSGKRSKDEEVMSRIAFRMSEQEIANVAEYVQHLQAE